MEYLIGADPELFVQFADTKELISAHNLVPGNKLFPSKVPKGAVQPDGTSAEFNIHPASSAQEFTDNIREVLLSLQASVQSAALQKHPGREVELKVIPTAWFHPEYFKKLPAQAKVFGCSPDWNAWTQKQTQFKGTRHPFRTGAGHIHIGWTNGADSLDEGHWNDCILAVQQLDCSLYFTSLLWDSDQQRRTLYGKMGAFRPKPYGVEYRPLSNAWVADPELHKFVFETALASMNLLDKHDTRLYTNPHTMSLVERTQAGKAIERNELIAWHTRVAPMFNLPTLPLNYLQKEAA